MTQQLFLHPDRLFPVEDTSRKIARNLYYSIKDKAIISPHGHTEAAWFANNQMFGNPHELLITPDHYLIRMLYSQGISMADIGIAAKPGEIVADARSAWRTFAKHYYLYQGTPTGFWFDHIACELFNITKRLDEHSADEYFDIIDEKLKQSRFNPPALFKKINI